MRSARSIVGICERNQTYPRQCPLLKRNPKRTRPHCIPQYTTRIQHIYETPEILRSMIFSTVLYLQSDNAVSTSNTMDGDYWHSQKKTNLLSSTHFSVHPSVESHTFSNVLKRSQLRRLYLRAASGQTTCTKCQRASTSCRDTRVIVRLGCSRHEAA